eukprot:gene6870-34666_t
MFIGRSLAVRGIPQMREYSRVAVIGAGVMADVFLSRLMPPRRPDAPTTGLIDSTDEAGGSSRLLYQYESEVPESGCSLTFDPESIAVFDVSVEQSTRLAEQHSRCHVGASLVETVDLADLILLAVKPQNVPSLIKELRGAVGADATVLSVMAGTPMRTLANGLGVKKVIRTMPNTPCSIGQGVNVWCATHDVGVAEQEKMASMLSRMGEEIFVADEKFLDMATSISGSGPAYVYLAMESMVDAGVQLGFPRDTAVKLVQSTFYGASAYTVMSPNHLAEDRNAITSPGGVTAAALYVLERGGLRTTMTDAVFAAHKKSVQLSRHDVFRNA